MPQKRGDTKISTALVKCSMEYCVLIDRLDSIAVPLFTNSETAASGRWPCLGQIPWCKNNWIVQYNSAWGMDMFLSKDLIMTMVLVLVLVVCVLVLVLKVVVLKLMILNSGEGRRRNYNVFLPRLAHRWNLEMSTRSRLKLFASHQVAFPFVLPPLYFHFCFFYKQACKPGSYAGCGLMRMYGEPIMGSSHGVGGKVSLFQPHHSKLSMKICEELRAGHQGEIYHTRS